MNPFKSLRKFLTCDDTSDTARPGPAIRLGLTALEDREMPAFIGLDLYQFNHNAGKSVAAADAILRTVDTPSPMPFTFSLPKPVSGKSVTAVALLPTSVVVTPGQSAPPHSAQASASKKMDAPPAPTIIAIPSPGSMAVKLAVTTPATQASIDTTKSVVAITSVASDSKAVATVTQAASLLTPTKVIVAPVALVAAQHTTTPALPSQNSKSDGPGSMPTLSDMFRSVGPQSTGPISIGSNGDKIGGRKNGGSVFQSTLDGFNGGSPGPGGPIYGPGGIELGRNNRGGSTDDSGYSTGGGPVAIPIDGNGTTISGKVKDSNRIGGIDLSENDPGANIGGMNFGASLPGFGQGMTNDYLDCVGRRGTAGMIYGAWGGAIGGGLAGAAGGGTTGFALGSMLGPVGAVAGAAVGGLLGGLGLGASGALTGAGVVGTAGVMVGSVTCKDVSSSNGSPVQPNGGGGQTGGGTTEATSSTPTKSPTNTDGSGGGSGGGSTQPATPTQATPTEHEPGWQGPEQNTNRPDPNGDKGGMPNPEGSGSGNPRSRGEYMPNPEGSGSGNPRSRGEYMPNPESGSPGSPVARSSQVGRAVITDAASVAIKMASLRK